MLYSAVAPAVTLPGMRQAREQAERESARYRPVTRRQPTKGDLA
jgi:hypothetical protein